MPTIKTVVTPLTAAPIDSVLISPNSGHRLDLVDPGTYTLSSIVDWYYKTTDTAGTSVSGMTKVAGGDTYEVAVTDTPVTLFLKIEKIGDRQAVDIEYDQTAAEEAGGGVTEPELLAAGYVKSYTNLGTDPGRMELVDAITSGAIKLKSLVPGSGITILGDGAGSLVVAAAVPGITTFSGRVAVSAKDEAPVDASLPNNSICPYIDGATGNVMLRVRLFDGTYATCTIVSTLD